MASVKTVERTTGNLVETVTVMTIELECPDCYENLIEVSFTFDQIPKLHKCSYTCQCEDCEGVDLVIVDTSTTFDDFLDTLDSERKFAAVCWLIEQQEDFDTLEEAGYDDNVFECGGIEFRCLTDAEADDLFQCYMEDYVEECALNEVPSHLHYYFDTDSYIDDVKSNDGRGPTLTSEDSEEHEIEVNDEYWFIYRIG